MKRLLLKNIVALVIAFFSVLSVSAQGIKDVVINEVLAKNVNNYTDNFGHRAGWIELKNSGYTNVNLASAILEVVGSDGKAVRYRIPKGDPKTILGPQAYTVFFADGIPAKGTFYLNSSLEGAKSVALFDASGNGDPIAKVSIDYASAKPDVSMGRLENGDEFVWGEILNPTPNATNETVEKASRSEQFKAHDPHGYVMAVTAMSVVFLALLCLFIVFKRLGVLIVTLTEKNKRKASGVESAPVKKKESERMKDAMSVEVITAIAVALNRYEEDLHDIESEVVTINRVARTYSPWSSKIYGVNNQPVKK